MSGRVLVVEDDKYLNKLLSDRLKLEGFEVEATLDGESAWEKLKNGSEFDLLVSDMLLPRTSGAELFRRIRDDSELKDLRCIAISGIYKDPDQIEEIQKAHHLDGYWTKPFDLNDLIAAISGEDAKTLDVLNDQGDLGRNPIEQVFLDCYDHAFTGQLLLTSNQLTRKVFFLNGFPVGASSTAMSESLGQSLVALKLIDEQTREKASRDMVAEKLPFGQMILKIGALTKDELFQGLRKHSYRLLLNTLLMRNGEYKLEPLEELPEYILKIEFNPILLMLKAQKSAVPKEALLSIYETKQSSYPLVTERFNQLLPLFNLGNETQRFFQRLPANVALQEILRQIPQGHHEMAFRIFYLMESLKLIDWLTEASDSAVGLELTDFEPEFSAEKQLPGETAAMLQAEYVDILNKNYFEILGIPESASITDVNDAYNKVRYKFQPERFGSSLTGQNKRIIDDILTRIDQAYQTLSEPEKRQNYEETINRMRADSAANSKKYLQALDLHNEGLRLLERNAYPEARAKFEEAFKVWDQNFEYQVYAKYAHFRAAHEKDPETATPIMMDLREIAYTHPKSDTAYLLLGYCYQTAENMSAAKDCFEKALKNNESLDAASTALARIGSAEFKKRRYKINTKKLAKNLRTPLLLLAAIGTAVWVSLNYENIWYQEEGIVSLPPDAMKPEFPSLSIRQKGDSAKVVIQKDWLRNAPDSVLKGKCNQVLQRVKSYGIIRVYIYDQEAGLSALCREDRVVRFDKK